MKVKHVIKAVVIDDDKETVELFSELLSNHDIKVVGKGFNGQDAVYLYQKLRPDVIFLDVLMPVFNGIYALEKIRELNTKAIVIMVANNLSIEQELKINRLRPSAVIKEPIDVNEIIIMTNQLCATTTDTVQQMKKTVITLAIKNTLLELGIEEFDKVNALLQKDFSCAIEDCYDHPEYLKQVLQDLFGESYPDILSSLIENMKSISKTQTKDFLQILSA